MKKLLFILLILVGITVMLPRDGFAPLVTVINEPEDTSSSDTSTVDLSDVDEDQPVRLLRD